MGAGDCPPWCVEHVAGPGGSEHRAIVGDVRLAVVGDSDAPWAVYAVRRRSSRTPAEKAKLLEDLTAAGGILAREERRHLRAGSARCGPAWGRSARV
jgi:hypothetical protein